jgi:uncharacterized protein (TIGR02466 family)
VNKWRDIFTSFLSSELPMATYPPVLTQTSVRNLFASPLIVSELPADIVADTKEPLITMLLSMEKKLPSQLASNLGGWQSDDQIMVWGGDAVKTVVAAISQLLDQVTLHCDQNGMHRGAMPWKINGWGNVNRSSNANMAHTHPGAYWTAVYYVASGDQDAQGGELQLFDPRGSLPLMYAPTLRVGVEGYLTAGNCELYRPCEGQCVIFPSWLSHAVRPYTGGSPRISLAFNFAI